MPSFRDAIPGLARCLLLLTLLTLPAWAALTQPGLPTWQAGPLPVLHLYATEQGDTPTFLGEPDRWRSEGPWNDLMTRLPRALGVDGVAAVKTSAALSLLALALGLWGWATLMAGYRAGVLAAMLAVFAPPLLSALYDVGDTAALWVVAGLALAGWGLAWRESLGWSVGSRWGIHRPGSAAGIGSVGGVGAGHPGRGQAALVGSGGIAHWRRPRLYRECSLVAGS